jgi:hypothetical protein
VKRENVQGASSLAEFAAGQPVESGTFLEPFASQHSRMEVGDRLTLGSSHQQTIVREVEPVLENARPSSSPPVDWEKLALPNVETSAIADTSASIELDPSLAKLATQKQERTNGELATGRTDHEFTESVLNSKVLNELQYSETAATTPSSELQLDFRFSPARQAYRSSLLPEETQPTETTISLHPHPQSETIKDYYSGEVFPSRYLARIRGQVDPNFSNENWGDEYYFSDSYRFWYIEDYRANPNKRFDCHATQRGLELRARKIPERTGKESWKSFEESIIRVASDEGNEKAKTLTFEEMQQRIQQQIQEIKPQPLFRDLQPNVQQQKINHSRKAIQGTNFENLVAPGVHPFRFRTSSFVKRRLSCNGRIEKGRFDRNAQLQQWSRTTGKIPDGRFWAIAPLR